MTQRECGDCGMTIVRADSLTGPEKMMVVGFTWVPECGDEDILHDDGSEHAPHTCYACGDQGPSVYYAECEGGHAPDEYACPECVPYCGCPWCYDAT